MKKDYVKPNSHHNLYSRGSNAYDEYNSKNCAEAMAQHGWTLPVWVTMNQIENANGKYAFKGMAVLKGEHPEVIIVKCDHRSGEDVHTPVYNIEQTNFKVIAPGAYELLQQGKTFDEVCDQLMHQPLITRAMHQSETEPTGFFNRLFGKRVAAAL